MVVGGSRRRFQLTNIDPHVIRRLLHDNSHAPLKESMRVDYHRRVRSADGPGRVAILSIAYNSASQFKAKVDVRESDQSAPDLQVAGGGSLARAR